MASGSPVLGHGTLPNWARLMLVVRDGKILTPEQSGLPRDGDYAYLLAPPERVRRLDRLFVAGEERPDAELAASFPFRGDIALGVVSDLYGLPLEPHERDMTIADLFAERFDDRPAVGNRVHVGSATLVVRALDGERVGMAGLVADDEEDRRDKTILSHAALARLLGPRRISRGRLRRRG